MQRFANNQPIELIRFLTGTLVTSSVSFSKYSDCKNSSSIFLHLVIRNIINCYTIWLTCRLQSSRQIDDVTNERNLNIVDSNVYYSKLSC